MQQDQEQKRGWNFPAGNTKGVMPPGLYLVATPIGNLGDMTFRALDVIDAADVVYCEDTRVSGKLLSYFGLEKKLAVYNDHSDEKVRAQICQRIQNGDRVVLISDAGMPLISDPGYKLVRDLREKSLHVSSIPGANAPLAALQLSGLPSDQFAFLGFLPAKQEARRAVLKMWSGAGASLIAFETGPRLLSALKDIDVPFQKRCVSVCREITKKFEEVKSGAVAELISFYENEGAPKGEIVLVIGPPDETHFDDVQIEVMLRDALITMSTKDAAAEIADVTGLHKKELYQLALKIKGE